MWFSDKPGLVNSEASGKPPNRRAVWLNPPSKTKPYLEYPPAESHNVLNSFHAHHTVSNIATPWNGQKRTFSTKNVHSAVHSAFRSTSINVDIGPPLHGQNCFYLRNDLFC